MSKKAFLLFHLNLSFSSIGIQSRRKVIKNCYWPLLNLANKNNIKIMLEFSGKTLEFTTISLKEDKEFLEKKEN